MQSKIFIQYIPGSGALMALFYVELENDIYGWFMDAVDQRFSAAFFMLEHFYAVKQSLLYRSIEDDVYSPWRIDSPPQEHLIECPLPEPVRHELERLQSNFVEEWLFFATDPEAEKEIRQYDLCKIPVRHVNIRQRKIRRMDQQESIWQYRTPGCDLHVVDFVQKHWRVSGRLLKQWHKITQSNNRISSAQVS